MNVTLGSDAETFREIRKWFELSGLPRPSDSELRDLLARYRALQAQGLGKISIVVQWKKEGVLPMTAAAFVNAMERIEGGIVIQDPNERPSMVEIIADYKKDVDAAAGAVFGGSPYLKIGLAVGAALALYAFAGGLAKGIISK